MTAQQHVLCVSRAHGKAAGGMERLSFELTGALSAQPELRVTTFVYEGPRLFFPWWVFTHLPRIINAGRTAHVIHLGDPMLAAVGWVLHKLWRVPICVTVHGLDVTYPAGSYQLYLHLFFRGFDRYIAISHHVQTLLQKKYPTAAVQTVVPATQDNLFDPTITREQLNRLVRLPTTTPVFFTCGRLIPRKGHAWFIRHVLPHLPDAHYVIAGDGPARTDIKQATQDAGLHDRVHLLGRIDRATLKVLYNTIDAFIQPNIAVPDDVEGFGLVLLEAALCGRVVFASRCDGIPDAIHHGLNGILLTPGAAAEWQKALRQFMTNSRPRINQAARAYTLDTFSWSKTAAHYADIFKEVAQD